MTAVGQQTPAQQESPGDLAEGEPEMRLDQTPPAEVGALGDRDTHLDITQRVGVQQRAHHALPSTTAGGEQSRRQHIKIPGDSAEARELLQVAAPTARASGHWHQLRLAYRSVRKASRALRPAFSRSASRHFSPACRSRGSKNSARLVSAITVRTVWVSSGTPEPSPIACRVWLMNTRSRRPAHPAPAARRSLAHERALRHSRTTVRGPAGLLGLVPGRAAERLRRTELEPHRSAEVSPGRESVGGHLRPSATLGAARRPRWRRRPALPTLLSVWGVTGLGWHAVRPPG